jgi:hypothetical protein
MDRGTIISCLRSDSMEMQPYYGVGGRDVDWFHPLAEFPALPLYMSPPPLLTRSVESVLEIS